MGRARHFPGDNLADCDLSIYLFLDQVFYLFIYLLSFLKSSCWLSLTHAQETSLLPPPFPPQLSANAEDAGKRGELPTWPKGTPRTPSGRSRSNNWMPRRRDTRHGRRRRRWQRMPERNATRRPRTPIESLIKSSKSPFLSLFLLLSSFIFLFPSPYLFYLRGSYLLGQAHPTDRSTKSFAEVTAPIPSHGMFPPLPFPSLPSLPLPSLFIGMLASFSCFSLALLLSSPFLQYT